MRCILSKVILASFVLSVLGRYLPPESLADGLQLRQITDLPLSTGSHTPRFSNLSASSSPASIPDTTSVSENSVRLDGAVSASRLDESADEELWSKHTRKGNSLMCAMCGTDAGAGWQLSDTRTPPSAASKWSNFNDMIAWYWWEARDNPAVCDMGEYWGMATTFRGLKLNPRSIKAGGNMQCFHILHQNENAKYPDGKSRNALSQSYTVDGKLYHATNAAHFFAMDTRAGVIVGVALIGADYAAERLWGWAPNDDELPKLRNLSDIFWLYWRSLNNAAGTRVDNLNAYIVYAIHNQATLAIISRALKTRDRKVYESWPGQYYASNSEEGSPIGATMGFFLMQHKKDLGDKYVSGIRIVRNDGTAYDNSEEVDLVFHIADVPPDRHIADDLMDIDSQSLAGMGSVTTTVQIDLISRHIPGYAIEEQVLGSNDILRVHTFMAN